MDHIDPVIPISGFTNFDDFIQRLFCPVEGFQILCKLDHNIKTKAENKLRREYKKNNK